MNRDLHNRDVVRYVLATRASISARETIGTRWQDQAHTSEKMHHRDTMTFRLKVRCAPALQIRPVLVRETSGTRWQDQAHMSKKLHHLDTMKLRQEVRCIPGPQGRPVPVRETSSTRWQDQARTSEKLLRFVDYYNCWLV